MLDIIQRLLGIAGAILGCFAVVVGGRQWVDWFAGQLKRLMAFHVANTERRATKEAAKREVLSQTPPDRWWKVHIREYSLAAMRANGGQFDLWVRQDRPKRGLPPISLLDEGGFLVPGAVHQHGVDYQLWVDNLLKGEMKDPTGRAIKLAACALVLVTLGLWPPSWLPFH